MLINIDKVRPGMTVGSSIYNQNGVVILHAGKELTDTTINALRKNGIANVDIALTKEQENIYILEKDIPTTITEELKNKSIDSLKSFDIGQTIHNSKEIVKAILDSKQFSYSLLEYKGENSVFSHSVRVAAFAAVLSKYYNEQTQNESINMEHLVTASLLHDIGETLENQNFKININKLPESLKDKIPGILKMNTVKYDPKYKSVYSYGFLKEYANVSADVKLMVLFSDENQNGTGPLEVNKKLMGSKQGYMQATKIIHLCDIYDNLLKKAIETNLPLENVASALELYSLNGILDKELTDLFIKHVPLYSAGIKVKLSDGSIAIVKETFTERINNYKPIVQIIPTKEIVDLRTKTDLTVKEICGSEISFAEIAARQIIDMNNETTTLEEHRKAK